MLDYFVLGWVDLVFNWFGLPLVLCSWDCVIFGFWILVLGSLRPVFVGSSCGIFGLCLLFLVVFWFYRCWFCRFAILRCCIEVCLFGFVWINGWLYVCW